MKVKQVQVTYGRKFNTGNYTSANLEATVWADLDEGENPTEVIASLFDVARGSVRTEFKRLPTEQ